MDWTLLGLEPTKEKKTITAAYRARLAAVNPEDKPEEFKALRAAYEEALRLADQGEETPVRDESPVGRWIGRVRALYDDFAARIRPENWKELLADDVCIALDKRPMAEEALLRFLMEDFYIPQPVWQLLDETFSLTERRAELYESYPKDFVDYAVMNGIRFPASLPYELFIPGQNGKDCDEYRRLYHQANRGAVHEMGPILEQMEALSERHPYGQALVHRFEIENGQVEQGREGCRRLAEAYPNDTTLTLGWAVQCVNSGSWAEGEKLTRRVLECQPNHGQAKRLLAECLAHRDRQEEAKKLIFELMHAAGGDQKQLYQLNEVVHSLNDALIRRGEEHLRQHPEDSEAALELGWCYLQNDRNDDALGICRSVAPDYKDQYDYHHLYAKVLYGRQEPDKALEHLEAVERILRALQPDGTDETAKRLRRLPEMLQIEGSCLYALNRRAEAREKYEQALALAPEDAEVLTQMAHLLYAERDYDRAVEVLETLTGLMSGSYHGYLLLARNLYELGRDQDAFEAVNRALELEGGDLGVYVLKMRILLRNGVWDGVRNILDFLHQNGVTDDLSVLWCEAQWTEFGQKDREKALEQYQTIARRLEGGEPLPWASKVYFRITELLAEHRDARKEEDRAELLAVLEQGLAYDEDDPDCMDYKAWLLKRDGRCDEALALYHRLEALPRRSLNVERELAELYYRDLTHNADKALHYYQMLLDNHETAELHFYAGTCRRYLGDWTGAEQNYLREREMDPEDVDAYHGLGYVYEAMGRYGDALENAEKAIDLRKDLDGDQSRYYFRKVQILRRLNRPLEAVAVVDEIAEKYGYDSAEQLKFKIYCQFGLWDAADAHLKAWRKTGRKRNRRNAASIKLDLYRGRLDQARNAIAAGEEKLNSGDLENLRLQLAELDDDTEFQVQVWNERLERRTDLTHALMNLAQTYYWAGEIGEARRYAARALEELDHQLKLHLRNGALYRSRRAMALALLGRMEEARIELEAVRAMPLCEGCDYGSCKDADIFEANMEEVCGNWEKALALHRAGMERWPDDLDFAAGAARMRRKGF